MADEHSIGVEIEKKKRVRPKSGPANAYSYGAKEPATNLDEIRDQFHLAHKYRNKLVEIEHIRRERTESALRSIDPELVDLDQRITELDEAIESVLDEQRNERVQARKKVGASADIKARIKALKADRRLLYNRLKELRARLFSDSHSRDMLAEIDESANESIRVARAECGLYWGTYLIVEDSAKSFRKGKPPKFMRRNPGGCIAVQVQGGMTFQEALDCKDKRFRIEPVSNDAWIHPDRRVRKQACKTRAWIRIGTDKKPSRPRWAVVPFTMHRPIPPDARIKWVRLVERKAGTHSKWSLNVSLEYPRAPKPADLAPDGVAGVDVGWRRYADGSIRVAYWAGSDGQHGEVLLPSDLVARFRKIDDLQSIRDGMLNEAIAAFRQWKSQHEVPEWLAERTKTIHAWRAAAKLASVMLWWRENRFDGDGEIYSLLEAWRKQDKHLYDWQRHQHENVIRSRREIYRLLAVQLRRRYATVTVEDIDFRHFSRIPEVDKADDTSSRFRRNKSIAAPSEIVSAIDKSGTNVVRVYPAGTSQTCSACGVKNGEIGSADLWVCPSCGTKWDRDHNAAINIMRASGQVVAERLESLAGVGA